ncbi:riboflavin kinase [Eremomyces bilateralis CBS 781.70]|uniref:Riboflavin kinase n=1 Tax=Eremomyces bilateralis CBS 781.70 TaxID=1392243 RepID=A0A6G1G607_9PEZI|nr:riboflavin kinase [Eremomyces bilateralis CBS 781.70]KAF1813452.1 riboflavin kinase [Eremomyces bilateralis CBS 781.70]
MAEEHTVDISKARPRKPREPIAGPDKVGPPFPLRIRGPVIKGFGRGSKELGIPTANIPISGLAIDGNSEIAKGVYYGWAGLDFVCSNTPTDTLATSVPSSPVAQIHPAVLSIGNNPFYNNERLSCEVHLLHGFKSDFYGARMSLMVLGYIRPEYDYEGLDALIEDIKTDVEVARRSLAREDYLNCAKQPWLVDFGENWHADGGEGDDVGTGAAK